MTHFHVGHNTPGYLPDSDEPPYAHTVWDVARDDLMSELERYADHVAMMSDYDPGYMSSLMTSIDVAQAEVREADEGDSISVHVCSDGPHDLGQSYWLMTCSEDCEID